MTPHDFNSINDIKKIPIITKEDINLNLSEMISLNYSKKNLKLNSTGGLTGYNLKFFSHLKRHYIRQSFVMRGNKWANLNLGTKHAFLWGSPFDESLQNSLKGHLINRISGSIFLSSYELSDLMIRQYAEQLNKFKPEVIIGYPSALYAFSNFINENNIYPPNLKSIITSAETLYDFQRVKIESVFQCKIYDRYGCGSWTYISHECSEHNGLHMNLEHLYVELLDDNYQNTEGTEKYKLIITDLDNYAMPFIRYEIGDMGEILESSCSCGRNLPLMNVQGRSFDIIIGLNGNRLGGTFWTLLFRTLVNGIEEFQVIQKSKYELNINLITNNNFKSDNILILEKKIKELCGLEMIINFRLVDYIPKTKSGKQRFVISNL